MIDFPPDIPVVAECAGVLSEGWRETEECLFGLGFQFAERREELVALEVDYWTAIGVLNGETPEEAAPKGESTKIVEILPNVELTVTELDSPFLLLNFENSEVLDDDDIHRAYEDHEGRVVVLLDEPGTTSIDVFLSEVATTRKQLLDLHTDQTELLDVNIITQISRDAQNESWSLMRIDVTDFESLLGRPSRLRSVASYAVYSAD